MEQGAAFLKKEIDLVSPTSAQVPLVPIHYHLLEIDTCCCRDGSNNCFEYIMLRGTGALGYHPERGQSSGVDSLGQSREL